MTDIFLPEMLADAYHKLGPDQEETDVEKFFTIQYEAVATEADSYRIIFVSE